LKYANINRVYAVFCHCGHPITLFDRSLNTATGYLHCIPCRILMHTDKVVPVHSIKA
jgi:hypothetical protein